jgi:hypothetical protein
MSSLISEQGSQSQSPISSCWLLGRTSRCQLSSADTEDWVLLQKVALVLFVGRHELEELIFKQWHSNQLEFSQNAAWSVKAHSARQAKYCLGR